VSYHVHVQRVDGLIRKALSIPSLHWARTLRWPTFVALFPGRHLIPIVPPSLRFCQAVLLEGRAWQSRAAAVLAQPSVVAAAAAAVEADPCASICTLWNADIAAAAALEMKELDGLIGEKGGEGGPPLVCVCVLENMY